MSLIYTSPTSRHNLYLGGKADAKSRSTLQQRNILRILNVTPAKDAGVVAGVPNYFENSSGSKIKYKRIPVYDASTSDLLSYADEIVQFISNGLHHGSVLVHCQRGASRSATSVIMFLMRKVNMTLKQSLALCKRRRPMVDPISAFLEQLRTYEQECISWGHLTVSDVTKDTAEKKADNNTATKASAKVASVGPAKPSPGVGDKRKTADSGNNGDGNKKKRPTIGPPRGPAKPAAAATIGPAMGPPTSVSGSTDVGKGVRAKSKKTDGQQEAKKQVIGPTRPPVKVICPMKPPTS